jgi:hypothetical protein
MPLSLEDHQQMLRGFGPLGFRCLEAPDSATNPVKIEWRVGNESRKFQLWSFEITHGGGGAGVRAADEYRIQITNGPGSQAELNAGGVRDLLVGYSRLRESVVVYDIGWLQKWIDKQGGSPSVQVKEADIQAGHDKGIHHLTKDANFGHGHIVTINPARLPSFLLNDDALLKGNMTPEQAQMLTPNPATETIVDYCSKCGFPFDPDLIARYLASLLTKPFVILAGVSGTGKSKLAELVAEFYTAGAGSPAIPSGSPPKTGEAFVFAGDKGRPDPRRFALVAVRPDWIDNQSILGFLNPVTERYESTQALDLILRADAAVRAAAKPLSAERYFLLLDEMNLARVEHYFSDWLACAESRRLRNDGSVVQQPVTLHRSEKMLETTLTEPDGTKKTMTVPAYLTLPTNLIVTGTVNVDETTPGFSPKVLDRAMVIEFDEVDLERLRTGKVASSGGVYNFPSTLLPFSLATRENYASLPVEGHNHIVAINQILNDARLHLGYRPANEIALFVKIYSTILPPETPEVVLLKALDAAILQKVLPRLTGNRAKLEAPVARLSAYLRDGALPSGDMTSKEFAPDADAKFQKSYRRAVEMLDTLREFGFVSFFK